MTTFSVGDEVYFLEGDIKRYGTVVEPRPDFGFSFDIVWAKWSHLSDGVYWMRASRLFLKEDQLLKEYTPSQIGDREDDI